MIRFVIRAGHYARIELDVATKIEPICDMIGIALDFRLSRIHLGPFPLLLEFR